MTRSLRIAAIATAVMAHSFVLGDTVSNTFTLSGVVGSHVDITISGLDGSNNKSLFSDIAASDLTNGYIVVTNAIQLRNLHANKPVYLKIRKSAWTLPATYDTTNGSKKEDGSDSDFLVKVNSGTLTKTAGTLTTEGTLGTTYNAVTNTALQILKVGGITSGKYSGLKNGSVDIDAKILLDPVYDVPGSYTISLELSIADQ